MKKLENQIIASSGRPSGAGSAFYFKNSCTIGPPKKKLRLPEKRAVIQVRSNLYFEVNNSRIDVLPRSAISSLAHHVSSLYFHKCIVGLFLYVCFDVSPGVVLKLFSRVFETTVDSCLNCVLVDYELI